MTIIIMTALGEGVVEMKTTDGRGRGGGELGLCLLDWACHQWAQRLPKLWQSDAKNVNSFVVLFWAETETKRRAKEVREANGNRTTLARWGRCSGWAPYPLLLLLLLPGPHPQQTTNLCNLFTCHFVAKFSLDFFGLAEFQDSQSCRRSFGSHSCCNCCYCCCCCCWWQLTKVMMRWWRCQWKDLMAH